VLSLRLPSMAVLSENSRSFRAAVGRNGSLLACVLFVLAVVLGAALDRSLPLAVYLLSFWHFISELTET
jgi:hypothetical protein